MATQAMATTPTTSTSGHRRWEGPMDLLQGPNIHHRDLLTMQALMVLVQRAREKVLANTMSQAASMSTL